MHSGSAELPPVTTVRKLAAVPPVWSFGLVPKIILTPVGGVPLPA